MNSIPAHFCAKFNILQGVAQSEKGSFRLSHTFATENAYGGTRALPRNRAQSALFGPNQASPSQILAPDFEACNIIYFLISLLKKLNNFTEVRYVKSIFILTLFQSHIIHHLKSINRIAKGCTMCKVHCSVAGFVVYIKTVLCSAPQHCIQLQTMLSRCGRLDIPKGERYYEVLYCI